jgi:predicted DNA-binding protein (UPF0251 family)
MVRPRKIKKVFFEPNATYFKPSGVPLRDLDEVVITLDELETLRLSNIEKLSQTDAANLMDIHQSTFQRTLTRAREKIADALINSKAIKIFGGEYQIPVQKKGFGRNRSGMQNQLNDSNQCICPNCGYKQNHIAGKPCNLEVCPVCKKPLIRG